MERKTVNALSHWASNNQKTTLGLSSQPSCHCDISAHLSRGGHCCWWHMTLFWETRRFTISPSVLTSDIICLIFIFIEWTCTFLKQLLTITKLASLWGCWWVHCYVGLRVAGWCINRLYSAGAGLGFGEEKEPWPSHYVRHRNQLCNRGPVLLRCRQDM